MLGLAWRHACFLILEMAWKMETQNSRKSNCSLGCLAHTLELAGVKIPLNMVGKLDGYSLVPLLESKIKD